MKERKATESVLDRYTQRAATNDTPSAENNDNELLDDFGAFGWLRACGIGRLCWSCVTRTAKSLHSATPGWSVPSSIRRTASRCNSAASKFGSSAAISTAKAARTCGCSTASFGTAFLGCRNRQDDGVGSGERSHRDRGDRRAVRHVTPLSRLMDRIATPMPVSSPANTRSEIELLASFEGRPQHHQHCYSHVLAPPEFNGKKHRLHSSVGGL